LAEHYSGKWPFWLSPRQAVVVPIKVHDLEINKENSEYSKYVESYLKDFNVKGLSCEKEHRQHMKEAFEMSVRFILVVGKKEVAEKCVTIESRNFGSSKKRKISFKMIPLESVKNWFRFLTDNRISDEDLENHLELINK
jgi:threonyl-tRNA synthetase